MAKIPLAEPVTANIDADSEMLKNVETIDMQYRGGQIIFTFDIAGDNEHYINLIVDEDDFEHALKKAKVEEEIESDE